MGFIYRESHLDNDMIDCLKIFKCDWPKQLMSTFSDNTIEFDFGGFSSYRYLPQELIKMVEEYSLVNIK